MKPVICKACRSKKKLSEDEGGKLNLLPNISELIRPSSSIGFSVSKIGMIFGNLTFEPTLAFPLILHGKSQVVTAHDHPHFYSTSTTIHFNQQYGTTFFFLSISFNFLFIILCFSEYVNAGLIDCNSRTSWFDFIYHFMFFCGLIDCNRRT